MKLNTSIFKKFYFWIIFLLVSYTAIGFLLVPFIVKSQAIKYVKENLDHDLSIEKICLNPYIFKAEIKNFEISKNGERILSFDNLKVDLELLKSILEKHIDFKHAILTQPSINLVQSNGSLNLSGLIPKSDAKTKKHNGKSSNNINVRIQKTVIQDANFNFINKNNDFELKSKNLNYTFYNLSTFEKSLASQTLLAYINEHTVLKLKGGIYLNPLTLYGDIEINNIHAHDMLPYIKDKIPFDINDAVTNLKLGYWVYINEEIQLKIKDTFITLDDLKISKNKKQIINLNNLQVSNLRFNFPQNELLIDSVDLNKLHTNAVLDKNNNLNLLGLVPNNTKETQKKETKSEEVDKTSPFKLKIDHIALNDSKVSLEDINHKFNNSLKNIDLKIDDFNLENNSTFAFTFRSNIDKASIKSEGKFSILPLSVKNSYAIEGLALKIFQNYINDFAYIKLTEGIYSSSGNFEMINDNLKYLSDHRLKTLEIKDQKNQKVSSLKDLKLTSLSFDGKKNNFEIKSILIDSPYAKIAIDKQKNLNLAKLIKKSDKKVQKETKTVTKKEEKEIKIKIGPAQIKNASMTFEDASLPIPFKTDVEKINGKISSYDSKSITPSKINLEGVIDKYGYFKTDGTLDTNDLEKETNAKLLFKNIALNNLSPYSGKFIGRKIKSGKLTLDLMYNIENSKLNSTNNIILHKIELGDKIESKDAMDLPLSFAIALLEDSNGVINLNLPIQGDMTNPEFSLAPIIWKAFGNLIVKAVASPFTFLASLLGIEGGEELKTLDFGAGEHKLLPPEKEKLDHLAKILNKRPKINLSIQKSYAKISDTAVLQISKFNTLFEQTLKTIDKSIKEPGVFALELLYSKTNEDLKQLKSKYKLDEKESKKAYIQYLKELLTKSQIVTDEELGQLAAKRVEGAVNYLKTTHKIIPGRIKIKDEINIIKEDKKNIQSSIEVIID